MHAAKLAAPPSARNRVICSPTADAAWLKKVYQNRRLPSRSKTLAGAYFDFSIAAPGSVPTFEELKLACSFNSDHTLLAARRSLEDEGHLSVVKVAGRIVGYRFCREVLP